MLFTEGMHGILRHIRSSSVGTAAHFKKALGQAPMLEAMNFIGDKKGEQIAQALLQHADDLDYLQELTSSVAKKSSINPTLNAVVQAYTRRRFKAEGQSVELETLVHQSTKTTKDDDVRTSENNSSRSDRLCWAYQRATCSWQNCGFQHRCSLCNSKTHGAINCPKGATNQSRAQAPATERSSDSTRTDRPPHQRYRKARAHNPGVL